MNSDKMSSVFRRQIYYITGILSVSAGLPAWQKLERTGSTGPPGFFESRAHLVLRPICTV